MLKRGRKKAITLIVLGISTISISCSLTNNDAPQRDTNRKAVVTSLPPLSQMTLATIKENYSSEPKQGAPLSIGLALSGGGTRAGMFAHGVLQGLNDSAVLDHLDAISSVSGGSYAGLWYYTKRMEANRLSFEYHQIFADCVPLWWEEGPPPGVKDKDRTLISTALKSAGQGHDGFKKMNKCHYDKHYTAGDPYRWQVHLSRWPDIFRYTETIPSGNKQGAPWRESVKLGVYSLGEILVSPLIQTGIVPSSYQYGIERAWGLNPAPRTNAYQKFIYTNDTGGKPQTFGWHLDEQKASWEQLRKLYGDNAVKNLPLWIVNTTSAPRGPVSSEKRIFEITPFGQGSELNGYLRDNSHVIKGLGESVRASAAALDAQGADDKYAPALSKRNFLFPVAEWGVTIRNWYRDKTTFRLSDGGHSENLGVYSLLRRGTKDIIIVDATQDVNGSMQDLCLLIKMLSDQGITLKFDDKLEHLDSVCASTLSSARMTKKRGYDTSAWLNPVIPGRIIWPSYGETKVWLIKLGWDRDAVGRAFSAGKCESKEYPVSCMLTAYYGHNTETLRKNGTLYFPHLTTMGAGFSASSYLFWAYRELGRTAASGLQLQDDGTITLKPGTSLEPQKVRCFDGENKPGPCIPAI